jgi:thioredoxin reductase (NADPH)
MEEAMFLTKFASKVTIIHRRDEFRASAIMVKRALEHPKIEVVWDTVVEAMLGDDALTGLTIRNVKTDQVSTMQTEGLFVAIGHTPNTDLFRGQLDMDEVGYLTLRGDGSTATSVDGVFAAGDVADSTYRQAITAAGTGCQAAIDVERWLDQE